MPDPLILVLSEEELEILKNTKFENPKLERTRDLFILQTYVLLRLSDFKELGNYNYDIINKQIFKYQTKTGDSVTIPLPTTAIEILKKYDYQMPRISGQKYNENIKDMFKELGYDNLIEEVSYSGNQKIVTRKPRYEFMSSHTARRTGITLLIKRGVPVNIIMKISGHRTIEALMSYIRITKDEAAEVVRNAWEKKSS
ncbi:MAG: tyrosine-type recombinase/integrase [Candidatus Woesearchaeota archaeon]